MARVKRGVAAHARHKKVLKLAKGYRGRAKAAFRVGIEKVEKGLQYAYRDRRNKKRAFRGLWIQRINAATREHGMTYSQFMNGILQGRDRSRPQGAWPISPCGSRQRLRPWSIRPRPPSSKFARAAKALGVEIQEGAWTTGSLFSSGVGDG